MPGANGWVFCVPPDRLDYVACPACGAPTWSARAYGLHPCGVADLGAVVRCVACGHMTDWTVRLPRCWQRR